MSNGTAALHLACLSGGLKKGDEAITSPISFLATSNAVLYCDAIPVFADIDYDSVNINPKEILRKITNRSKAIIPVHFAGLPCNIEEIYNEAKKHDLIVIEDACHALGSEYKSKGKYIKVGSCEHSDMCVFSFHPVKHITTGEGGIITTNNKDLYEKLLPLRSHGVYKNEEIVAKNGSWYYEMRDLGYNYRITDFQCSLGISQLKKLDRFIEKRRDIAKKYDEAFSTMEGVSFIKASEESKHAYHLYVLKIDLEHFNFSRQDLVFRLKEKGILTQVHYIPIYWQPYYKSLGFQKGSCPNAEKYYDKCLSIPIFPKMSDDDVQYVIEVFRNVLS